MRLQYVGPMAFWPARNFERAWEMSGLVKRSAGALTRTISVML